MFNLENLNHIEIKLDFKEIIEENCKEVIEKIKQNAKSMEIGGKEYINNWTYKLEKEKDNYIGVVYNQDHYRLTHLLEKGHLIKNKYGSYGYTAPREHIKPAFNSVKGKFENDMRNNTSYEITNK